MMLTPAQKERQRSARSRAGRIRMGMVGYLETLALIAQARRDEDHIALGYESWAAYVDAEFGKERLQLTAEMREKAVTELRLGGASQREIGHTLGLSPSMVNRTINSASVSYETDESDPDLDSPARSPLVEAMTGAIEDAEERNEAATTDRVDPVVASPPGSATGPGPADASTAGATGAGSAPAPVADTQDAEGALSPVSSVPEPVNPPVGEGEQGGPATSPAGPPCEKCGGKILPGQASAGYTRCDSCDPEGDHQRDSAGDCGRCKTHCHACHQLLPQ